MEITSLYFGILSIISVFIYYLINPRYRIAYLTILSCAFIATYSYVLLIYVTGYSLINYFIGIKIQTSGCRKAFFRAGIILNLLQLILMKYASFTIDPLFQLFDYDANVSRLSEIIIPVGISFFTLQGIGYLININMKWEKPEKNFIHFFLYIIFYPRFLSGPVDRSNHFLPQLKGVQTFNRDDVAQGLRIALAGLFKKIAIANQLAPFIAGANSNPESLNGFSVLVLMLIQPLYLYFDFSGYTDIATGFARTIGVKLRPNFNSPFLSENMTTFWKRFHISLSSWFHDYVFMRTSYRYRRLGIFASVIAIFVTWILFGIWHGAGWNFMLLGVLQGSAILYEFFTKKLRTNLFSRIPNYPRKWVGRIFTYLFYSFSLVFFFSSDIDSVVALFSRLNDVRGSLGDNIRMDVLLVTLFFIFAFMSLEIVRNDFSITFYKLENFWMKDAFKNRIIRWTIYFVVIAIVFILSNDVQQFIYFQF